MATSDPSTVLKLSAEDERQLETVLEFAEDKMRVDMFSPVNDPAWNSMARFIDKTLRALRTGSSRTAS